MSEVKKTVILQILTTDEYAREIAALCRGGKTVKEISDHMFSYYHRRGLSMESETVVGYVAGRISSLENIKAIEFREEKWFTTEVTSDILRRYFGI